MLPIEGQPTVVTVAWEPGQEKQFEFTKRVGCLVGLSEEAAGATEFITMWGGGLDELSDNMTYVQLVVRDDRKMPVNQYTPHLTGTICVMGLVCRGEEDDYQYVDFDRYTHDEMRKRPNE